MPQTFAHNFFVAVGSLRSVFLCPVAIDLKIKIWFLTAQLKKVRKAVQEHSQKPAAEDTHATNSMAKCVQPNTGLK